MGVSTTHRINLSMWILIYSFSDTYYVWAACGHICYVNYITPFPRNVSLGRLWSYDDRNINDGFRVSFSNDDGDENEDVKEAIGLLRKKTTLNVHHTF